MHVPDGAVLGTPCWSVMAQRGPCPECLTVMEIKLSHSVCSYGGSSKFIAVAEFRGWVLGKATTPQEAAG